MALWLHREVFVTCQTGIQIKGLDYLFKVKNVEDLQYILAGEPTKQKKLACFCYYTLCKSMFPRERMNKNHTPWTFKGWAMALHLWWMFHGAGALTVILKVVSFLVLMTLSSIVSGWDRLIILLKQAARRWIITKLWKINLQYSEFIFATNKKRYKISRDCRCVSLLQFQCVKFTKYNKPYVGINKVHMKGSFRLQW